MTMLGTRTVSAQDTEYLESEKYTQDFSGLSYTEEEDDWYGGTTKTWTYPEDWKIYKYGEPSLFSDCYSSGQSFGFASYYSYTSPYALVTPAFKGNVSFYVKQQPKLSSYLAARHTMFVYKMNSDGTLSDSIPIKDQIAGVTDSEWTQVTVNVSEYTRLALAPNYVMVSNLSADNVGIEVKRYLDITATTLSEPASTTSIVCDDQNRVHVVGTATVTNNGNVTFNEGDENYTVYAKNSKTEDIYQTINVPTLAQGESATLSFDFYIPFPDDATLSSNNEWSFQLNAMTDYGSSSSSYAKKSFSLGWFYVKAPKGIMAFYGEDGYHYEGKVVDFGMFHGTATKSFKLKNTGGGTLVIKAASYPDGVSIPELAELPYTLDAQAELPVTLTMTSDKTETISGTIEFTYDGIYDKLDYNGLTGNQIMVQGSSVKDGDYLVTFEDGKVPAGWYLPSGTSWSVTSSSTSSPFSSSNKYALANGSTSPITSAITPKLAFEEGETFNYQVSKRASSYGEMVVSYSTDRENWTELAHYGCDEEDEKTEFPSGYNTFNSYSVTVPNAGEYYFKFDAGYVYLDNLFGGKLVDVAHDVIAAGFATSGKYEVNSAYTMTATFQNLLADAETAGEYTVKFYANDKEVGEGDCSADFAGQASKTFTLDVTPHAAGDYKVKAVFVLVDGSYRVETEEQTITVAEEKATDEVVVGTKTEAGQGYPMHRYYKNSKSEVLYSASMLSEISANSKILKIAYPYYCTSGDFTQEVTVWVGNTDETSLSDFTDVSTLTQVYHNEEFKLTLGGSYNSMIMLEIPFDEGFEYTGGALKVVFEAKNASSYGRAYFAAYSTGKTDDRLYKGSDTYSYYESASASKPYSSDASFPVTYFYAEGTPATVTGTVYGGTYASNPKAFTKGAKITFKSGDVEYYATSDSEGKYSVDIVKSNLEYSAKAEYEHWMTGVVDSPADLTNPVDFTMCEMESVPVTITKVGNHDYGYTTFCDLEFDYELPEGVEARVYGVDEGSYTLVPTVVEGGVIPAGVAVVLYAEKTLVDYKFWPAAEALDGTYASELLAKSNLNGSGAPGAGTVARDGEIDGYYFYKLQYNRADDCVGFYWGAIDGGQFQTNGANKGWLYIAQDVAAKMSNFSLEDGKTTTGISTLKAEDSNAKGIYTVSGQKMNSTAKPGLYIVDGKKVVVK